MTDETDTAPVIDPVETPEAEAATPEAVAPEPEPEGEIVIQIGDEEPEPEPEQAPEWVRNLRRENRELQKRLKEIEAAKAQEVDNELGPEPELEDPEYDFDTAAWKAAWRKWDDKRQQIEARKADQAKAAEQAQQSWEAKVNAYTEAKAKVPFTDFDDAEAFVQDTFDTTQQGLLIKVAKDAPTLVYALGKNPKAAANLAGIKDYAEFVAEAVRLEMNVKTTRKPATSPEKTINVPAGVGKVGADEGLEKLREEVRLGKRPFTDIQDYKRKMKG